MRLEKNVVAAITAREEGIESQHPLLNRREFMVCRMFHPTNGRNNFEDTTCSDMLECKLNPVEMETKMVTPNLQRRSLNLSHLVLHCQRNVVVKMLERGAELRKRDDNPCCWTRWSK